VTPLTGSDYDRKENRTATTGIGGIVSQRLRYIEILLCQPWTVDFEIGSRTVKTQLPNPVSFLAQKLLIHGKRSREVVVKPPEDLFEQLTDDVRRAAEISAGRPLTPELVRQVCRHGLSQAFE
jgi:hypothetical protein